MKYRHPICAFLAVALSAASAQVASHAPTAIANPASAQTSPPQVSDKPVARVNGSVLTDRDLLRELLVDVDRVEVPRSAGVADRHILIGGHLERELLARLDAHEVPLTMFVQVPVQTVSPRWLTDTDSNT